MSGGFYQTGTYPPSVRRRNRAVISAIAGIFATVIVYRLASDQVSVGRASAQVAVVAFFAGCMWWAVASKTAGPVKVEPATTHYLRSIFRNRPKT